ncbi:hypothetical protein [Georgenia thermotolerans]|uniref:Uncharacterized protein n=1 Tax=Georgenia thermotolerans TaxID=527326 RepID=A0A7J5ULZ2_9MICO|nr:hypothetical protein [Georgenia thermotolerans]KAE8763376.1 hypothetical protein GB883_14410 [Georgenia thermotolerans]
MTAPHHATSTWETDFVVELRLRDVDGAAIGDALAQVRSHCAESGEEPAEAFGHAAAYARSLDLPRERAGGLPGVLVRSVVGLAAVYLTLTAFLAWREGRTYMLTAGSVVAVVVVAAALVALARHLRAVLDHPVQVAVAAGTAAAGAVLAAALWRPVVLEVPAPAAVAVGAVLLVGTAVLDHRAAAAMADPVLSPTDGAAQLARERGRARRSAVLQAWLLPAGAVVLMTLTWLLVG